MKMCRPGDFEDWAHLGPSGRGLRRRGSGKGQRSGGAERMKEGKENKQPGLVIQGNVHIKLEITKKRAKIGA